MRASTDVTSTGGKAVSGKEHQKKEYRQWGGRTRALRGREALRSVICVTMAETCKYAEAHPQTLTRTEDLSTSGAAQVYRDCFIWTVLKFCHMCSLIWSCSGTPQFPGPASPHLSSPSGTWDGRTHIPFISLPQRTLWGQRGGALDCQL